MCDRVIHRRQFEQNELVFETAVDIFKVIKVDVYNGLPTVWYETLLNPVYRNKVTLKLVFDEEYIPDNSVHVGSALSGDYMVHVYQVLGRK